MTKLINQNEELIRKTMPFFDFENPPTDPIKLKEEITNFSFCPTYVVEE